MYMKTHLLILLLLITICVESYVMEVIFSDNECKEKEKIYIYWENSETKPFKKNSTHVLWMDDEKKIERLNKCVKSGEKYYKLVNKFDTSDACRTDIYNDEKCVHPELSIIHFNNHCIKQKEKTHLISCDLNEVNFYECDSSCETCNQTTRFSHKSKCKKEEHSGYLTHYST